MPAKTAARLIKSVGSAGDSISALEDAVAKVTKNEQIRTYLVRSLFGLYGLHSTHDVPLDEIVDGVVRSADLDLTEQEVTQLADRLVALLSVRAVQLVAKAVDVSSAHARLFHTARVVTDMRPVFQDDVTSGPGAAIVTHSLHLSYFSEGNDLESIFIALNSSDLDRLIGCAERAKSKEAALLEFATQSGLEIIEGEG